MITSHPSSETPKPVCRHPYPCENFRSARHLRPPLAHSLAPPGCRSVDKRRETMRRTLNSRRRTHNGGRSLEIRILYLSIHARGTQSPRKSPHSRTLCARSSGLRELRGSARRAFYFASSANSRDN